MALRLLGGGKSSRNGNSGANTPVRMGSTATPPGSPSPSTRSASATFSGGSPFDGASAGGGGGGGGGGAPGWSFSVNRPRKNELVDVILPMGDRVVETQCAVTMTPLQIKVAVQNACIGRSVQPVTQQSLMAQLSSGLLSNKEKAEVMSQLKELQQLEAEAAAPALGRASSGTDAVPPSSTSAAAFDMTPPEGAPDLSDLVLKVDMLDYYFLKESNPIQRDQLMQLCAKAHVMPLLVLVPRAEASEPSEDIKGAIKLQAMRTGEISTLVGPQLAVFLSVENREIDQFRRSYSRRCMEWKTAIQENTKLLMDIQFPRYMGSEPLSPQTPPKLIINVHFTISSDTVLKVGAEPRQRVEDFKLDAFRKIAMKDPAAQGRNPDDFWLKVTGMQEYIFGEGVLIDYDYVRKSISKGTDMHMTLLPMKPLDLTPDPPLFLDYMLAAQPDDEWVDPVPFSPAPATDQPFSVFSMTQPFRIRMVGLDNLFVEMSAAGSSADMLVYVMAAIYHGGVLMAPPAFTVPMTFCTSPRWNSWISFPSLQLCNIPKGTRVCFTVMKRPAPKGSNRSAAPSSYSGADNKLESADQPVGWVGCQLINYRDALVSGAWSYKLWMGAAANPIGTTVENLGKRDAPVLQVEFETFQRPVVFPRVSPSGPVISGQPPTRNVERQLNEIVSRDPLAPYSAEQKRLVWEYRHSLINNPAALPRFLLAVPWSTQVDVLEAHRLLTLWRAPSPIQALELLDSKFADPVVRDYAVQQLDRMPDGELQDFLLQMTQVLKYEAHHDSSLSRFLLRRALFSPVLLAHPLYWHLRAEMHVPEISERYGLLLEALLWGLDLTSRRNLYKQLQAQTMLLTAAMKIKKEPSETRKEVLHAELRRTQFPDRFQLPLDPRWEACGLKVEKCKYMDSKKLPLWLVFENAEPIGDPMVVIFKAGDDLRQDVLTLQLIRLMDKLWKKDSWDLRLQPYGCVATGDEIGFIEVVLNSSTTANINSDAGGATKVFKKATLANWLRANNPADAEWKRAQENFYLSCAGYCVATYVLGIGDRHNDNIMMTRRGHLFHIDFGHFLGNFKSKYGIKRERCPFVFTQQFAAVMDGVGSGYYKQFSNVSCQAFNVLRKNASLFVCLFSMMLSTGIPELQTPEDIEYLREQMLLDSTEGEAAKIFMSKIDEAVKAKSKTVDDFIHVYVHSKKK